MRQSEKPANDADVLVFLGQGGISGKFVVRLCSSLDCLDMTAQICLVSPYPELSKIAYASRHVVGEDFDIENANLEEALTLLPGLEEKNYQVFVSRGRTAQLIREHTHVPVVDIKINGFDVLDALADLAGTGCRVAFVGYADLLRDCERVANALKIPAYSILFEQTDIEQYEHWQNMVYERLEREPVDIMIGDTIPQSRFPALCGEFRLITSGAEGVRIALENAAALLNAMRLERANRDHLSTVLDMFSKAVFSLDQSGLITHANRAATKLFNMSRADMIGLPIDSVDPALAIARETIADRVWEVGQVVETRRGSLVCYLYPVNREGDDTSVVFALEQVEQIYTIEQKVRHQERQKSRFFARHTLDEYVSHEPEMQLRLDLLKKYAKTDATVLITGESGTGKELLAQGIHNGNDRAQGPFVAVNCGALPPTLLESELFGYVDGAFTGALRKGKKGLFELAHRGTLFLDEIGELDKLLQTRLLRVIQERELMRLGSENPIPVDIRIVAASNRNLEEMVAAGTFREDLFYRLNVLQIEMLPLRKRRNDIIPSALRLLRGYAQVHRNSVVDLDLQLRDFLLQYDWPGNFRQLGNIMERLAIVATGPVISLDEAEPLLADLCVRQSERSHITDYDPDDFLSGSMDEIRLKVVNRVLAEEGYSKTRTAKRLGVDRTTLNRWLK